MLPKRDVIQLLSHATVFACPSIYEPLGIVNLEAMACEAAVVASATGGIVEVVRDGETGSPRPARAGSRARSIRSIPTALPGAFAERVNALLADPAAGRRDGPRRAPAGDRAFRLAGDRRETVAVYERAGAAEKPGGAGDVPSPTVTACHMGDIVAALSGGRTG